MSSTRSAVRRFWPAATACLVGVLIFVLGADVGRVAVDPNGNIDGSLNQARELWQGKRFWRNQETLARTEMKSILDAPQLDAAVDAVVAEANSKAAAAVEEMYRRYPPARPTEATARIDALRAEADHQEQEQVQAFVRLARVRRLAELAAILPLAEQRAK